MACAWKHNECRFMPLQLLTTVIIVLEGSQSGRERSANLIRTITAAQNYGRVQRKPTETLFCLNLPRRVHSTDITSGIVRLGASWLFTFSNYNSDARLFSFLPFSGSFALFLAIISLEHLHKNCLKVYSRARLAATILFANFAPSLSVESLSVYVCPLFRGT